MDPVALSAIQAVQPAGAAHSPAIAPGSAPAPVANPSAITRFEAAMGVDAPQGVSEIPFASQVSAVWRSAQANNQGMLHRIRALTELRAEHSLSAADLVELQYEVMNLSFQQDVVTKVADKSSNAVQTRIKNQ